MVIIVDLLCNTYKSKITSKSYSLIGLLRKKTLYSVAFNVKGSI